MAIVMAAAVEVWVRATWEPRKGRPGFFLTDAVRGQRLAPNYDGWFAGVPVHINRLELRDRREYELAKRPNTFRILVLGDSVTFGHGSVSEHTYPFLLEQRLKAWRPDVDWQVWNAAVPGYNTSQELAHLLEVGPRLQPDLVVVGFFENDLIDNRESDRRALPAKASAATLSFLRRHVYSLELYKRVYLTLAWMLSRSDDYHRRVEHLGTEESLLAGVEDASALKQQTIDAVRALHRRAGPRHHVRLRHETQPRADSGASSTRAGFRRGSHAVRGFQRLNAAGTYRVLFFLNDVPPVCPDGDVFYDGGSRTIDDFYLRVMSAGTPAREHLRRVSPRPAVADAERQRPLDRQLERRQGRRAVRVCA